MQAQQRNQLGLPAHLPPMPTPMPPLPAADAAPADPTRPSAAEEQLYDNYFDVRAGGRALNQLNHVLMPVRTTDHAPSASGHCTVLDLPPHSSHLR